MDKPEQQDGVWGGEGPQSSGASPTVTCEHEHQPERCMFPECPCASVPLIDLMIPKAPGEAGMAIDAIERQINRADTLPDKSMLAIDDFECPGEHVGQQFGARPVERVSVSEQFQKNITEPVKRAPKRDRAAYMRDYRARTSAARTQ
jgi:hypothetical protein